MEKSNDFQNVETSVDVNANEAIQPTGAPTGDGVNREEKSADKSSGRFRQAAAVTGGAVAGAALVMGFTTEQGEEAHEVRPPHQSVSVGEFNGAEVPVAHNLTPDMNFEQSFAAARTEVGAPGVFYYSGDENHPEGYYGTFYGSEWENLSPEYRDSFGSYAYHHPDDTRQTNQEGAGAEPMEASQQPAEQQPEQERPAAEATGAAATDQAATGEQQPAEVTGSGFVTVEQAEAEAQQPEQAQQAADVTGGDTAATEEQQPAEVIDGGSATAEQAEAAAQQPEQEQQTADATGGDTAATDDVEVLGVQYTEIDGHRVAVAPISVDSREGLLIDVDADGIFDYAVSDNGTENPDVEAISGYRITHDDVNHLQETGQPETPPEAPPADTWLTDNQLPDYTNNAPIEDYAV